MVTRLRRDSSGAGVADLGAFATGDGCLGAVLETRALLVDRAWQQNESDASDEDRNEQGDRVRDQLACRRLEASAPYRTSAPVTPASIAPIPPGIGMTWAICPIR